MAERKETIVLEFEVDEDESIESINKLTKANKELRTERNALNIQSEAGKKRAQEINALIDQNTSKIKNNVSAIEKQKINIGNYKSALDGVHPALGKVGQGLEAGTKGFMAMARAALAFIATPIGALLAALVAVFTLLKTAISTNNEVFDKFENITNAIGVVMDVLIGRVGKLGEALIALAQGNFSEAIEKTSQAFGGLADEIERAIGEGQLILDLTRDLEDAERQLRIEQARQENEIRRLVVASKNRNLSLNQQEDLLRRALALEERLVATKEKLALQELEIAARSIANEKNIQKAADETYEQFANRLVTTNTLSDEIVDGLVENIEKLEQARGSSLAFQEKVENNLSAIQEKRALALEKQNKALKEQAERQATINAVNQRNTERDDKPLENAFNKEVKISTDLTKLMREQLEQRGEDQKKYYDKKNADAEKAANLEIQIEQRKLQIISGFIGSLGALAKEDSQEFKVIASAKALIDTYAAANAAYRSGAEINVFFGIAAAAAAIIAGLANVAKINSIEFAEGGWTGPGHKMKPAGIVHAGEVVWSQEDVRRAGGPQVANAMRPTFRGYADGGLVAQSISQPIDQQMMLSNIFKNMPPSEVSVVEVSKVQRRVTVKEKLSRR